jgi:hypothetical protein
MPKNEKTALRDAANSCFQGFNIKLSDEQQNIWDMKTYTNSLLRYDVQLTPTAVLAIQATQFHYLNIRVMDNDKVLYREQFLNPCYADALLYLNAVAEIINDSYYCEMDLQLLCDNLAKIAHLCGGK